VGIPNEVALSYRSTGLAKLYAANSTATSFASLTPTTTTPSGDGVVKIANAHGRSLRLMLIGEGADNATGNFRVVEWYPVTNGTGLTLYIPVHLIDVSVILSAAVGIAGSVVLNTERFADTITYTAGTLDYELTSPADDRPGMLAVRHRGASHIQVLTDIVTATSLNALLGHF